MDKIEETDILIIGSGIAGLTAAIYAAEANFNVTLITKGDLIKNSNTYYAQGGIIYRGKNDSKEALINDIIKAGAGLTLPEAAEVLSEEGPKYIQDLLINKAHIDFTRNSAGELDLSEEAAHSVRRIIHSKDATGEAIIAGLTQLIKKYSNIKIYTEHIGLDLIVAHKHTDNKLLIYKKPVVLGAYFLNLKNNNIVTIKAKVTILATGGTGQIYRYTTNPISATGDGFAMAYRAGATLINMEFTQFHPTALYILKPNMFLISEAVRGEGAVLKRIDGKEFMHKYHPDGSLAPRDVVSRAIHEEMLKTHTPYVLLDIASYLPAEKIKQRFPTIYKTCLEYDIDITKEPIPVVPVFHFQCGGVRVNLWGKSNLHRLFAIGEVSCTGIHGANRLASTSLLEGLVWGGRAIKYIKKHKEDYFNMPSYNILPYPFEKNSEEVDMACIKQDWQTLKNIMWNYVGLIRSKKRLKRAISDLKNLRNTIDEFYQNSLLDKNVIELKNGVQTGLIIATAAYSNPNSIGTHFRID